MFGQGEKESAGALPAKEDELPPWMLEKLRTKGPEAIREVIIATVDDPEQMRVLEAHLKAVNRDALKRVRFVMSTRQLARLPEEDQEFQVRLILNEFVAPGAPSHISVVSEKLAHLLPRELSLSEETAGEESPAPLRSEGVSLDLSTCMRELEASQEPVLESLAGDFVDWARARRRSFNAQELEVQVTRGITSGQLRPGEVMSPTTPATPVIPVDVRR